jgi:hypothetical protein
MFQFLPAPLDNSLGKDIQYFSHSMRRGVVHRMAFGSSGAGSGGSGGTGFARNAKMEIIPGQKGKERWDGREPPGVGQMDPAVSTLFHQKMQESTQALKSGQFSASMIQNLMGQDLPGGGGQMTEMLMRNMSNLAKVGGGASGMGMMAFGMGENEKGKKVARAAKMVYDPATGQMKKDFVEQQLEPDDVQLPKETVENYDTSNCIEVELEEAPPKQVSGASEPSTKPQ